VSIDSPDETTSKATDVGRAAMEAAKVLDYPVGRKIYMTNALPYIRILEYGGYPNPPKRPTGKTINGFSTQAPGGMVRISVAEFNEKLVKAANHAGK
jgi:hypothetical protein